MVKIYLDDLRPCPDEWIHAKTAQECIELLVKYGKEVDSLSLDHDLGDEETCGTGYDVICWLEEQIFNDYKTHMPTVYIHSANPVGVNNIKKALIAINEYKAHWNWVNENN